MRCIMISHCGVKTVWALALVAAGLIPGGAPSARGAELTKYISSDFCAALVIHPERIKKSTLAVAFKEGSPTGTSDDDSSKAAIAFLKGQKSLPPGMDPDKLAKLLV